MLATECYVVVFPVVNKKVPVLKFLMTILASMD